MNIKCDRTVFFNYRTFDRQMFGDLGTFDDPEFGRTHRVFCIQRIFAGNMKSLPVICAWPQMIRLTPSMMGETYMLIASNAWGNGWMAEVDAGDINTILTFSHLSV